MRRLRSLLVCGGLAAIVPACANVIYSTGFENPPFTLGPLAGQGGWSSVGPASATTVENTVVKSGSQAVQVDSSQQATGPIGPSFVSPSSAPVIDLYADLRIATSTNPNGWQFGARGPTGGAFIGGILIGFGTNASLNLIAPGLPFESGVPFTRDVWHHVDFLFNFPAQTYTFTLDGTMVASGVAFCGDTTTCAGGTVSSFNDGLFDTFVASGKNDFGYMDNYSVASVPEPSAILLLGAGFLVVAVRMRPRAGTSPRP